MAEGVPEDQVGIRDVAISLNPGGESCAAGALIGVITGSELLVWMVRCDPDVMVYEAGTLAPPRVARGEWEGVVAGEELVAGGVAHGVLDAGVDDLPGAAGF